MDSRSLSQTLVLSINIGLVFLIDTSYAPATKVSVLPQGYVYFVYETKASDIHSFIHVREDCGPQQVVLCASRDCIYPDQHDNQYTTFCSKEKIVFEQLLGDCELDPFGFSASGQLEYTMTPTPRLIQPTGVVASSVSIVLEHKRRTQSHEVWYISAHNLTTQEIPLTLSVTGKIRW